MMDKDGILKITCQHLLMEDITDGTYEGYLSFALSVVPSRRDL